MLHDTLVWIAVASPFLTVLLVVLAERYRAAADQRFRDQRLAERRRLNNSPDSETT